MKISKDNVSDISNELSVYSVRSNFYGRDKAFLQN